MNFSKKMIMLSLVVSASAWAMQSANAEASDYAAGPAGVSAPAAAKVGAQDELFTFVDARGVAAEGLPMQESGPKPTGNDGLILIGGLDKLSRNDYGVVAQKTAGAASRTWYLTSSYRDLPAIAGVAKAGASSGTTSGTKILLSRNLLAKRDFSHELGAAFSDPISSGVMLGVRGADRRPLSAAETRKFLDASAAVAKVGTPVTVAARLNVGAANAWLKNYNKAPGTGDVFVSSAVYKQLTPEAQANVKRSDEVICWGNNNCSQ